ncbi:MAG: hypothetical protein ACM3VT_12410 [Solirubrobacterales bacterium]
MVEGEPLEEGATVTVLAPEQGETFVLDSEAEASLLAAMAEGDRDEVITGERADEDESSARESITNDQS